MSDNTRLIVAAVLAVLILMTWEIFFASPQLEDNLKDDHIKTQSVQVATQSTITMEQELKEPEDNENAPLKRIIIEGENVVGSIDLVGARLDDISLPKFITENNKNVQLFSKQAFAEIGWISNDTQTPTIKTHWNTNKDVLTANDNVELWWKNADGVKFIIRIALDEHYMFNIEQIVENNSGKEIEINSYSLLSRTHHDSGMRQNMMVHEGGIGVIEDTLQEFSYDDIAKKGKIEMLNGIKWLGFSDKYWLSVLIPDTNSLNGKFARFYNQTTGAERYQTDFVGETLTASNKQTVLYNFRLFVGAKELNILEGYKDLYDIPLFDRAVDFGMLYFITKPIFLLLSYFYNIVGNFGIAILILTVFIKILLFPLAFKGFKGMNRLKELQPKMMQLKERHEGKPQELQKEMLALYKKEKVNPISGCLPLLLQMPVFFALYKVLYVSIEMRNAPFFGWIHDLSAPDPTSIFNLFGLIPWTPPALLMIGVLPILMSLTMFLQQQLSPAPTDPVQAKVMKLLPLIFLVMFASFPSGLVLYIAWSNILSIVQQLMIKKLVH